MKNKLNLVIVLTILYVFITLLIMPASSEGSKPKPTSTPEPMVVLEGSKIWDDGKDADHIRPAFIIISLLANGRLIETFEIAQREDDKIDSRWTYYLGEYPKYDDDKKEIVYSIKEETVDGYETHYRGMSIINSHPTYTPAPDPVATPAPTGKGKIK